jgi:hypothetical protein
LLTLAAGQIELGLERGESALAAIEFEPAGLAQVGHGARLFHQQLVLGDGERKQRAIEPRRLGNALGPRGGAEGQEPGRDLRQEAQVVVGLACPFERDLEQPGKARRKGRRQDGRALDHPGVAVGGLLAHAAAVDQRDRHSTLDELQGDRGADDAGAQHHDVGACHSASRFRPSAVHLLYGIDRAQAL